MQVFAPMYWTVTGRVHRPRMVFATSARINATASGNTAGSLEVPDPDAAALVQGEVRDRSGSPSERFVARTERLNAHFRLPRSPDQGGAPFTDWFFSRRWMTPQSSSWRRAMQARWRACPTEARRGRVPGGHQSLT